MNNPLVSVVIPTLFRPGHTVQTLEDLLAQNYKNFEVIVVEQEKQSPEIVDFIKAHDNLHYSFLDEGNTPRAKNTGARQSKGEIIVFLDDDVRLPIDFITKYVKALDDPSVGSVAAKILQPSDPLPVSKEGRVGRVTPFGHHIANFGSSAPTAVQSIHGCSAHKREAFEKAGGFDENFIGNAMREETDLSFRIRKAGYTLLFDPSNEFIHVKAPMGGTRQKVDRMDWYFDFFHNDFLFFLKNLKWRWMPVFFLSKIRPILACGFYYGKGRPKAVILPLRAYFAGYKTYRQEKKVSA